jgi:hypothetical protein
LKKKRNARKVYDPTYPRLDHSQYKGNKDWRNFYGDVNEAIPPNAPQPRGQSVMLRCYVVLDHAENHLTRRSQTGLIQTIKMARIACFSQKQGLIEGTSFGSKFIALKTAVEANRA